MGVYELDFERSATSTISVHDGRLRILPPDGESLDLMAHSPTQFSGDSQYGPLTLIFETNGDGEVVRFVAYATFSRFKFERR